MRDWDYYDYEREDDGAPLALKIMELLGGGLTLFILAVLAKKVVDIWTGG